jgi:hypothetical protein
VNEAHFTNLRQLNAHFEGRVLIDAKGFISDDDDDDDDDDNNNNNNGKRLLIYLFEYVQ